MKSQMKIINILLVLLLLSFPCFAGNSATDSVTIVITVLPGPDYYIVLDEQGNEQLIPAEEYDDPGIGISVWFEEAE